jgi:hypothetical protein
LGMDLHGLQCFGQLGSGENARAYSS